jgi:hypothetical protein
MKYNAPFGSVDPNAPFADRSTPNTVQGSKVPAQAIEHPQREIVAVIASAGIVPSAGDTTQLLQALQYYFAQLPIYPEILTSNGRIGAFSPATGVVRVPAGIAWVMRGATRYTSVLTDLATLPSKTYHLRWDKANGFRLRSMADGSYNPGGLNSEDDPAYDSTYDDMLLAKVTTTSGNVVTVTNLTNRASLADAAIVSGADVHSAGANTANFVVTRTLNWARKPASYSLGFAKVNYANTAGDFDINITDTGQDRSDLTAAPTSIPVTRYGLNCYVMWDNANSIKLQFSAGA